MWTVSGERLNPSAVKQAKEEELHRFEIMRVYSPVPRSQMESDPDGIKIDAKWVVTQKGTPAAPIIKARLVAREFAAGDKRDDLFARTPGLNALRYAVSQAATGHRATSHGP